MTTTEIRQQINLNNKIIQNMFSPNSFTLNNTVASLLEKNKKLQELCPHCFEDGYCIYCDKAEEG